MNKGKTAREMFEELGFILEDLPLCIKYEYHIPYSDTFMFVRFDFTKKKVYVMLEYITMELYKAITKQLEELGWV